MEEGKCVLRNVKKPRREHPVTSLESEISGLTADLTTLIGRFGLLRSSSFDDFSALWHEMRMPELILIVTRSRTFRELVAVMEETLSHLVKCFHDAEDSFRKYGILFLIYSLYFIQPTVPKIKARLTVAIWESIKQLVEEAIEAGRWHVAYTCGTLMEQKAFHFVATSRPLIPEKIKNFGGPSASAFPGSPAPDEAANIEDLLNRVTDIDEFELAQNEYSLAKQSLGSLRLPGLDRADSNVSVEVTAKLRKITDS